MFQISIDTGGTFTDGVLLRDDGKVSIAKAPTTPHDPSEGVLNCIKLLAGIHGITVEKMLKKTNTVTLGSTIATNTILQLKGAKIVMITTKNFRDILEMRRVIKPDLFNLRLPKPMILVPRHHRLGVEERISVDGEVITSLNEGEARQAVAKAKAYKAEVVAVCFLHSYVNPQHERRMAEIIRAEYPQAEVVLSSDVWPRPMEFERFSTTVLAAYVSPLCSAFLRKLENRLKGAGFENVLLIMTSNAGVTTTELAIERPILMVGSSPSAAPLFASYVGKQIGVRNMISFDVGGTSADISVIPEGRILTTTDGMIGDQRNAFETIDVISIGAGGGSIAYLDSRSILCVGPESAGAEPGPVCYGKGGQAPTVTDADVILGYIPADYFLGGEIKLDLSLAQKAIKEHIADPLGMGITEAAYAIYSVASLALANRISLAATSRGYDPRDFTICCGGGAGPTHIFSVLERLSGKDVYIPKVAAVLCAYGMMCADFKHEASQFVNYITREADLSVLSNIYQKMEEELTLLLEREGAAREAIKFIRGASVRYYGQLYEVEATMSESTNGGPVTPDDLEALIKDFHKEHEQRYGHSDKSMPTQLRAIKVTAMGLRPEIDMAEQPYSGEDPSRALKRKRPVFFKELGGFVETPCYDGDKLQHGNTMTGPAIIEEKTTTLVVPPKARIRVDRFGNYFGKLE